MRPTEEHGRRLLTIASGLALLSACGMQAFVNRSANLAGQVVTSDDRTGVPCTVTALLFGEDDAHTDVAAGAKFSLTVGMMTPANAPTPVTATIALRVACQGYPPVTTPSRDTEVAVQGPPSLDFGTITVAQVP